MSEPCFNRKFHVLTVIFIKKILIRRFKAFDFSYYGRAPQPWDIPVSYQFPYHREVYKIPVPNTAKIDVHSFYLRLCLKNDLMKYINSKGLQTMWYKRIHYL